MRKFIVNTLVAITIFLKRTQEFIQKTWILLATIAVIVIAMYLFNISLTIEIKQAGELLWTIG
ncbi:MAG: hypothetical protein ACOC2E_03025 [Bacteroidota bacterium]